MACASLATLRARTSSLSGDTGEGKLDRLPAHAAELVRLKVDVIVTTGATETTCAKEATATVPIVMIQWRRSCWKRFRRQPGAARRKHHGIDDPSPGVSGKRLELMKEVVPKLSRVAVFGSSDERGVTR